MNNLSGPCGFVNMNGYFSAKLDVDLKMNSDAFHAMNMNHQWKAVKEVYL